MLSSRAFLWLLRRGSFLLLAAACRCVLSVEHAGEYFVHVLELSWKVEALEAPSGNVVNDRVAKGIRSVNPQSRLNMYWTPIL